MDSNSPPQALGQLDLGPTDTSLAKSKNGLEGKDSTTGEENIMQVRQRFDTPALWSVWMNAQCARTTHNTPGSTPEALNR